MKFINYDSETMNVDRLTREDYLILEVLVDDRLGRYLMHQLDIDMYKRIKAKLKYRAELELVEIY